MSILLLVVFFAVLCLGVPLAFTMGIAALAVVSTQDMLPLSLVPQRALIGADSFSLLAIPFFILAGNLMNHGGITTRIIAFANAIVGRFTGGLGLGNIVASMLFAGVSGSAVADTTALGSTLIPAMKKEGYDGGFSAAVTAASSICGPIIPPSIPLVIYGLTAGTGVSIGALFLGGAIPGLILGLSLLTLCWLISKRRSYPIYEAVPFRVILQTGLRAIWAIFMPLIILVGVVSGIFTVTESAAVAVVYALIVGMFIYRELRISDLFSVLVATALDSAKVMIIVAMASAFGWIMAFSGLPKAIADLLLTISENPTVILLIMNVLLLVVGTFMEAIAAMIILIPVLVPVAVQVGIDLHHLGVILVFNLMLGLLTPPVGICLYIAAQFARTRIEIIIKEVMPFFTVGLLVLLLITLIPDLVLLLPRTFM